MKRSNPKLGAWMFSTRAGVSAGFHQRWRVPRDASTNVPGSAACSSPASSKRGVPLTTQKSSSCSAWICGVVPASRAATSTTETEYRPSVSASSTLKHNSSPSPRASVRPEFGPMTKVIARVSQARVVLRLGLHEHQLVGVVVAEEEHERHRPVAAHQLVVH